MVVGEWAARGCEHHTNLVSRNFKAEFYVLIGGGGGQGGDRGGRISHLVDMSKHI